MAKPKMKLVNILAYMDDVSKVLERITSFPCIELVESEKIVQTVHGSKSLSSKDNATPLLQELSEIEKECHTSFEPSKIEGFNDTLDDISKEIKEVHLHIQSYNEELVMLETLYSKYDDAKKQVGYLETLNVSLDDIFECDYVNARVGKLPLDSVAKLEYYHNTPFIFKSFAEDEESSWCMYFATNGYERAVDNIFSSLLFERVFIPDFVHGTPAEALGMLEKELSTTKKQIDKSKKLLDEYLQKHELVINRMKSELEVMKKIYQSEKYVVCLGTRFSIVGFIDEKKEEFLRPLFSDISNVEVEIRPADSDKRLRAPKKITSKSCPK